MSETVTTILNDEQVDFLRRPDIAKSLMTSVDLVQEIIGQLRDALPALRVIEVNDIVKCPPNSELFRVVRIYDNGEYGGGKRAVLSNRNSHAALDLPLDRLKYERTPPVSGS